MQNKHKTFRMILLSCALVIGVIFAVIEIAWRYLSPGEPEFALVSQEMAERLFNRPPKTRRFLETFTPVRELRLPHRNRIKFAFV